MDARDLHDGPTIDLASRPALARGAVRLDPPARSATGPAGGVTLEPRVMQVLLALLDAGGGVVAREALLRACWGPVIVGDDALNRAIAGVRRALREIGAEAWQLETIARVGYRLRVLGATDGPPAAASPPSLSVGSPDPPVPGERRRRWLAGAGLLGLATLGGMVAVTAWPGSRRPVRSPELEVAMQQARQALRLTTVAADQHAVAVMQQALAAAPDHAAQDAEAWGLMALAHRQMAESAAPSHAAAAMEACLQAADRALAQNPRQPDALWVRATALPAFGRWGRAEAALETVLEADPAHLPSLDSLAFLWAGAGIIAAHYPLRLKTLEGDPLHAGYNFRSIFSHWMNGALAAADQAGERGLELWPGHLPTWGARAAVFAYTGRAGRALEMLASAPTLPPPMLASLRLTWVALASGRDSDRAAARDAALHGLAQAGPLRAVSATLDLAALGEGDLALDVSEALLLDRGGLRAGTTWQPGQPWHVDLRRRFANHLFLPVCAPLRAHPRFARLMDEIGLTAYWARSGRRPDHLRHS